MVSRAGRCGVCSKQRITTWSLGPSWVAANFPRVCNLATADRAQAAVALSSTEGPAYLRLSVSRMGGTVGCPTYGTRHAPDPDGGTHGHTGARAQAWLLGGHTLEAQAWPGRAKARSSPHGQGPGGPQRPSHVGRYSPTLVWVWTPGGSTCPRQRCGSEEAPDVRQDKMTAARYGAKPQGHSVWKRGGIRNPTSHLPGDPRGTLLPSPAALGPPRLRRPGPQQESPRPEAWLPLGRAGRLTPRG